MKYIGEREAENFLEKEGFDVVRRSFCSYKNGLKKSLEDVGSPFVMKVSGKDIVHKNKLGGIRTEIKNYTNLIIEFEELKKIKGSDGVLFQKKLNGNEFLIGIKKTPEFGHVVLFGEGGIKVEEKKDLAFRVLPLEKEEIADMLKDTKVSTVLTKKDSLAIEGVILKISSLVKKYPSIFELDINPLMVKDGIATVVDARIVLE